MTEPTDDQPEAGIDNMFSGKPPVDLDDQKASAQSSVVGIAESVYELKKVDPLPSHWDTGCSNARRWVSCPGSKYAHDDDNDLPARVGTLGHMLTEAILRGVPIELTADDRATLDEIDDEELAWFKGAVKTCVDYVRGYIDSDEIILLERKIKSDRIQDHGGTIDVIVFNRITKMLMVIDFKFGKVPVNAADNYQLMAYLNLARQIFPDAKLFTGIIIQPRFRGVEIADFTSRQLEEFLIDAAIAADPKNMERKAGVEWCEHCPLLFSCKEAAKLTTQARVEFEAIKGDVFEGKDNTPSATDIELMERIVMAHKIADKAIKAASVILKAWQEAGNTLNYHKVVSTNRRGWKEGVLDVVVEKLGTDCTRLITITEAQKISGLEKEDFNTLLDDQLEYTRSAKLMPGVKPDVDALKEFDPV